MLVLDRMSSIKLSLWSFLSVRFNRSVDNYLLDAFLYRSIREFAEFSKNGQFSADTIITKRIAIVVYCQSIYCTILDCVSMYVFGCVILLHCVSFCNRGCFWPIARKIVGSSSAGGCAGLCTSIYVPMVQCVVFTFHCLVENP